MIKSFFKDKEYKDRISKSSCPKIFNRQVSERILQSAKVALKITPNKEE